MFIFQFFQQVGMFFVRLMSPFTSALFQLQRFRNFNVFRQIANATPLYRIKGFFGRIWYVAKAPGRYLNIRMPQPIARFLPKREGSAAPNSLPPQAEQGSRIRQLKRARPRRYNQFRDIVDEDYAQIHLVYQPTGTRTVLHLGAPLGRNEVTITLSQPTHQAARVRFRKLNTPIPQITVGYVAGQTSIMVDRQELVNDVRLNPMTTLTVDGHIYKIEVYTFDAGLPPVTRVDAGWLTSIGMVRSNNEDAIGIYQDSDAYLFMVADGVGGGEAGELISEFAVRYLLATFRRNVQHNLRWPEVLEQAVQRINSEVWYFTQESGVNKAGTTLTAVVIQDWQAYVIHVGDSRLYHWDGERLRKVTTDHVRVLEAEQVGGGITDEPLLGESQTVLTRAIGKMPGIEPQIEVVPLKPGDKLLLATDGLTDQIEDSELAQHIRTTTPEDLPDDLVAIANNRRNRDNATAVALEVLSHDWDVWRARSDERIYTGYVPVRPLRLQQAVNFPTVYNFTSANWFLNVLIVIVIVVMLVWVL